MAILLTSALASEGTADQDLPRSPEEGGPRRWAVAADGESVMRADPSADAKAIATVSKDAILHNLGCSLSEGRAWCEVRPLMGGVRGYLAADTLRPARGPDGAVPLGPDDSSRRARLGKFDATAQVACAQVRDQQMEECSAGAARSDGGDATVVVRFSNGFSRTLYFTHGAFISANATMSGVGTDTDWRVEEGLHILRVDDQRFELPDTLVFGDPAER